MNRLCHLFGRSRLSWLCLTLIFLLPALVSAQPATATKIGTIEGITEYRLPNGLQILLYPDASSSRVTVNMTVLVGSRHEGYGETGMAHLLEHMLFKGCPSYPGPNDIPKGLRDHGADFNGTTWVDRTNYYETMPASDKNLEFAIKLESERLVGCFIRRDDLASEMTVVRNEFEAGENDPLSIMMQRMMATAYEWHNYGKSTIGNRSDIERVPVERLQAFYRKFYQPDNAVVVIAGKFEEKKALAHLEKYFGALKKPTRKLETTYTEEPPQDGERNVVLRRVGKVGAVGAMYHIPAAAHADFPACEVLANLLDYEPGGVLYKSLVLPKKATGVSTLAFDFHDPGALLVMAQSEASDEKQLTELRDDMLRALENVHSESFPKAEVERVKQKLLKQRELAMTDANRIGIVLSDWASKGDWRLFFLHRDRLEKVTPADVQRVARIYLKRSNRTAGLYLPSDTVQQTPIPVTPKVADLVKDYKGRAAVAAGESFEPTPANIEKRTEWTQLPSGIKAALLPKKTRGENVELRLTLNFGNEESLKGQVTAAEFLGVLLRRGTKNLTRQQLDDELDRLKAQLNVNSSAGRVSVSVQCKRESLPGVIALLGKMLREPTFPADGFDVLKRQTLEELQRESTEPINLAQRALSQRIQPHERDDVRYTPTFEEKIAEVRSTTPEQIRQLYAEQLGGTEGALALVGDFDPAETSKQLADILKDWKAKTPYRRIADQAFPQVKGQRINIETPDKKNAVYLAAQTLPMKDSDADYPAMQVGNFLLGGGPLSSRLSNRLRGKDGLSYGAGSQFAANALDPSAIFLAFAIYNPENVEKVDTGAAEEFAKFLKEGVTEKELSEGIKAYLEQRKNNRATDAVLVGQLLNELQAGRTYAFEATADGKIANLTVEAVNAAFRKHFDPKRLTIIRAGDFKDKK